MDPVAAFLLRRGVPNAAPVGTLSPHHTLAPMNAYSRFLATIYAGAGLWLLNVVDGALSARTKPVPLQAAREGSLRPEVDLAWLPGGPGLELAWRF